MSSQRFAQPAGAQPQRAAQPGPGPFLAATGVSARLDSGGFSADESSGAGTGLSTPAQQKQPRAPVQVDMAVDARAAGAAGSGTAGEGERHCLFLARLLPACRRLVPLLAVRERGTAFLCATVCHAED